MSNKSSPHGQTRLVIRPRWQSILFVIALVLLWLFAGCTKTADAQSASPKGPAVSVAPAVERTVNDGEDFSGRLESPDFVELRPRVSGTIDAVHFSDGANVRKGDLLFTIDPRPFKQEVARARSELSAAVAKADLAQSEFVRSKTLLDSQAVSKQEFDAANSSARTTQAAIASAEAALEVAKLNLEYTQVRAPISGRLSRANITVGNLVGVQSILTTLASSSRIYAYFDISEKSYLRLRSEASKGVVPIVRLGLANENGYPHDGRLDFVDNRLNDQTGAIRLRATFANTKDEFTPGLAAKLRLESPVSYKAVMVPERAIGTDQTRKFVYVVAADGKPQFREVVQGSLFAGMRVVLGGVKPGENVIVEGQQRVIPGVPVSPEVLRVDSNGMPIFPSPTVRS